MKVSVLHRAFLPSLEIVLFLLVFWISLFFMPDMLNSDGDLPRHITVGNFILETGVIPTRDVFSNTRNGQPIFLHEWLIEAVDALVYRAAGLNGIAWLTALLLALIYFVLAAGLRALDASAPMAFLAAFAAYFTGMIHQLPRPHLFAWLFLTLLLLSCEMFRKTQRVYWLGLFLPVMVLWANSHASFISAFIVLGIYAVGAALERAPRQAWLFTALLGLSFVLSFINPFSFGTLQHFSDFLGNRFLVDTIVEYSSPNFHNISTWLFAAWILFSIVLFGRSTAPISWTGLCLLCAWTALGLYSARNIPNFAIVAALVTAPVAETWLTTNWAAARRRLDHLNQTAPLAGGWIWAVIFVALLIAMEANGTKLDVRGSGNVFTERAFPVRAVDFLEAHPPDGNVFNEYTWGGYLLYRLYPSQRVFIDGAIDLYGEALTRDYLDIVNAREGWQNKLDAYSVRWVILPPDRPLAHELARLEMWKEWYRDESAGVWVRR